MTRNGREACRRRRDSRGATPPRSRARPPCANRPARPMAPASARTSNRRLRAHHRSGRALGPTVRCRSASLLPAPVPSPDPHARPERRAMRDRSIPSLPARSAQTSCGPQSRPVVQPPRSRRLPRTLCVARRPDPPHRRRSARMEGGARRDPGAQCRAPRPRRATRPPRPARDRQPSPPRSRSRAAVRSAHSSWRSLRRRVPRSSAPAPAAPRTADPITGAAIRCRSGAAANTHRP